MDFYLNIYDTFILYDDSLIDVELSSQGGDVCFIYSLKNNTFTYKSKQDSIDTDDALFDKFPSKYTQVIIVDWDYVTKHELTQKDVRNILGNTFFENLIAAVYYENEYYLFGVTVDSTSLLFTKKSCENFEKFIQKFSNTVKIEKK